MKKTISIALALIMVLSMLLTSCVDKVEVNVDGSDMLGAMSDMLNNSESNAAAQTGDINATTKETDKESANDSASTDNATDDSKATEDSNGGNTNEENQEPSAPEVPERYPTVNINGTVSDCFLEDGICESFTTASTLSNTKFEINIPVTEKGSYELDFNVNLGLTRTFSSGSKKATLALPKTVFKEGEAIPVAYSTSGLDTSTTNRPWLCITKNIGGTDKYISYEYVDKNTSGVLDVSAMTGSKEDASLASYVWLPAGEYRLYFIDESYKNNRNKDYWLHDDPISISIVPESTVGTTVSRSGSTYGSATISVENNIFCQGASIAIKYVASGLTAPSGTAKPWVAIAKTINEGTGFFDYYTHWAYTETTESGTKSFSASSVNSPQDKVASYKSLPEGSYKIYYVNGGNLQTGIEYTEPIGINIAPAATLKASLGGTSILSTSNPYNISNVKKTVTVTDADLEAGYITVSFSFESLKTNTTYFLNVQDISFDKK